MIILHDTRDKPEKHRNVDEYFAKQGIKTVRSKMYVGDVTLLDNQSVCIDLKRNLQEVVGNVCQQHTRFTAECIKAQEAGIKLIFLVEHGGEIHTLADVPKWQNPRLKKSPYAVSGERLYKIMRTYADKYGVEWQFCDKRCTGKRIVELLTNRS